MEKELMTTEDLFLTETKHFSKSLEMTVICSILTIEKALDNCGTIVPDTFYLPVIRKIWGVVERLHSEGKPYDVVCVAAEFSEDEKVNDNLTYHKLLSDILENAHSGLFNLANYVDKLNELRIKRQFETLCKIYYRDSKEVEYSEYDINNQIAKFSRELNAIENVNSATTLNIDTAMRHYLRYAESLNSRIPISTGFREIDKLVQIEGGQLIIIAARPSMGKTTLAMNVIDSILKTTGEKALFFSKEMKAPSIVRKLLSSRSGVPLNIVKKGALGDDKSSTILMDTATNLSNEGLWLINDSCRTIDEVKSEIKHQIRVNKRLSSVCIDYLGLFVGDAQKGETRAQTIERITTGLKELALEFNIPIFLLSQLNRDVDKRPDKRPMLSDLRDSGSIEQDADTIMFIYRDEVYNRDSKDAGTAEIIVGKQRDGQTGVARIASHSLFCSRFENLAYDYGDYDE